MTEQEWRTCTDPARMVRFLRGRTGDRQLRLFACAVTRLLPAPEDPTEWPERDAALHVAERFADGATGAKELAGVFACTSGDCFWAVAHPDAYEAAEFAAAEEQLHARGAESAALLRDIVGDPFRPARFDHSWRTRDVLAVAQNVYTERRFGDLPILADALEEAGCTEPELLGHLRDPVPHARGCWALDLLLDQWALGLGEETLV